MLHRAAGERFVGGVNDLERDVTLQRFIERAIDHAHAAAADAVDDPKVPQPLANEGVCRSGRRDRGRDRAA